MKEADIRKYARLMRELDLTGLEITEDNRVVRLERAAGTPAASATAPTAAGTVDAAGVGPAAGTVGPAFGTPAAGVAEDGCVSVRSPIVGLFYAAPAEDAQPYVSLGDRVTEGQTLCIVEAMKLMNEIRAEADGVIREICVTNGQMVEYGTELFRIRREAL